VRAKSVRREPPDPVFVAEDILIYVYDLIPTPKKSPDVERVSVNTGGSA
jgi:hypothetical protein